MPTSLELALLSMDVYEQKPGGLNSGKGLGYFQHGTARRGETSSAPSVEHYGVGYRTTALTMWRTSLAA